MKFNAKPVTTGIARAHNVEMDQWAVFSGKKYFPASIGTKEHATNFAATHSALWHIEQAKEALKQVTDVDDAKSVGFESNEIVDDVIAFLEKNDPDHDVMDSRGWLV